MTHITVEDLIGPCAMTFFSTMQLSTFARSVGMARSKYKIPPPATDGDENFVRVFRAHQNSAECFPLFLGGLWTSSLMLHQAPACFFGAVYIIGRQKYFNGYSEAAEKRMTGMIVSVVGLHGLNLCSLLGVAHQVFLAFFGKTFWQYCQSLAK